jgi:hypothetical protein
VGTIIEHVETAQPGHEAAHTDFGAGRTKVGDLGERWDNSG